LLEADVDPDERELPEPEPFDFAWPVLLVWPELLPAVERPLFEACEPLLEASAALALRRAWACLAARSPEALPLAFFRAAVARLTEAASLAAARALRGLIAVVAMS
jgi:hypothetical protein